MSRQRSVPTSRLGRLSLLGRLAGGIAGGMLSEGARQVARGSRPSIADLLLTPSNVGRIADRLSEMRGAAMKVGQLLSMDSGDILPPAFSELLARLREDAHHMPLGEVARVLERAWGEGWQQRFQRFHFTPLAAASIGQVHDAQLRDGMRVAVKIQYPGVQRSIDSDVDNVATLLRVARLLPEQYDVTPLLAEAKQQLHLEADYRHEAAAMQHFAALLGDDERFSIPQPLADLSNAEVLTMSFADGARIESLQHQPAVIRDAAATALTTLALREVFDWGMVQTDPNFANYQFDARTRRIQLLDFGATRVYPPARRRALRALLAACVDGSDDDIVRAATTVGYLGADDTPRYRAVITGLLRMASEPARHIGAFPFGNSDLVQRMSDRLVAVRVREPMGRLPPADVIFLHRKLGGLYLLLRRLQARVHVRELISDLLTAETGELHADSEVS
ncbi:MAG: AarF/ABC1/UbiB kinase family protein [Gammaproteobacteria bacterium]|nr:AarF/ABC1/UbiB kinase family protein [Gammaproteobacteria bacterium]